MEGRNRCWGFRAVHPQHIVARRKLDAPGAPAYSPRRPTPPDSGFSAPVSFLKSLFTWWNGATPGVRFTIAKRGVFVGKDELGNSYYEARDNKCGECRACWEPRVLCVSYPQH